MVWTDSFASNLLLASDSHHFWWLEIMCLETYPSWSIKVMAPLHNKSPTSFSIMTDSIREVPFWLEQTFARVLITLVLCILSQFPRFLDPLSVFPTFFQNVWSVLSVEFSVFSLLKTDFSPIDVLFVTSVESGLGKIFWVRFPPENLWLSFPKLMFW